MKNIIVQVDGLTFVTHGEQVTIWEGEPGMSKLIGTALVGAFVTTEDAPPRQATDDELEQHVMDEDFVRQLAQHWLDQNPELRPITAEQQAARESLDEVISDVLTDAAVIKSRLHLVGDAQAVEDLVDKAVLSLGKELVRYVSTGGDPAGLPTVFREAMNGIFVTGFTAGQSFERRGYRL